jgi:hypothetical protein
MKIRLDRPIRRPVRELILINPGRHRIKREVGTDYAGGRHRIEGITCGRARRGGSLLILCHLIG